MSGAHDVDCSGCGRRHSLSAEQARKQRVVRCDCGQFVRMDRALAELRSDPAPAPVASSALQDAEDEQTQMVGSLASVAAPVNEARARSTQASLSGAERRSLPAPRAPMPSLSGALWPAAAAASDKPLWYVDLGGSETVEMTIEQLIIARRSGKLGEGALVWRAGMSRWRPVGALIPTASRLTSAPPPAITIPEKPPSGPPPSASPAALGRPPEPAKAALASYERPLATLEFALEKPLLAPAREAARLPPRPPRRASEPAPRAPTPLPAQALARQVSVLTPVPPPLARASVPAAPVPPASTSTSVSVPVTLPPSSAGPAYRRRERPRWATAALALALCVTASASGAFLVRSLRARRQPLALSASAESRTQAAGSPPQAVPKAPSVSAPEPSSSTRVVDVSSLSLEPSAPRAIWHSPPVVSRAPAPAADDDSTPAADSDASSAPSAAPAASANLKDSDPPAPANSSPYSTGALDQAAGQ